MRVGEWAFSIKSNELERGGSRVKLESQCALVLQHLCEHAGEVVTRDDLLDAVWGRQAVSVQSVPVAISKLRTLLGDDKENPRYIETIPKRGYRLIAEIDRSVADNEAGAGVASWNAGIKKHLPLALGALLVFGLVLGSILMDPARQSPRVLYVADVANLTNDSAMNAVAAGASEILSSELARADGFSILRLRRGYGEERWVAPGLRDDSDRPTPLLTASIVPTEQGSDLVLQLEEGTAHRVTWTYNFNIATSAYSAGQRDAAHRLLEYYDLADTPKAGLYVSNEPGVEEIYLQAKYLWGLRGRDNNMMAANLSARALKLDPEYVPAHALLAEIYAKYNGDYLNVADVDTERSAKQHMEHAVAIDPNHPAVLLARTRLLRLFDRRPDLALEVADEAVRLEPQYGRAELQRASALYLLGRIDDALLSIDRAIVLDLGSPYVELQYLFANYLGARYDEVTKIAERLGPEYIDDFRDQVAASYYELGRHHEAMQTWFDSLNSRGVDVSIKDELLGLVDDGKISEAYRALNDYLETVSDPESLQTKVYRLYWSFYYGEEDAPLAILETIPITRDARFLLWIHRWPLFNRFKDNPAFQDYLVGLGTAQHARCVHRVCAEN